MIPYKLIKKIPFLTTLIFIIFLSIINQKETTKLKILIWDTPVLSIGTYLGLSAVTGFMLSYIITTSLGNENKSKRKIKYKTNIDGDNQPKKAVQKITYDNTLIERNINDPSPTINASFRVITNNSRHSDSIHNNQNNEYKSSDNSEESSNQFLDKNVNYKSVSDTNRIINDWEDDSFKNW